MLCITKQRHSESAELCKNSKQYIIHAYPNLVGLPWPTLYNEFSGRRAFPTSQELGKKQVAATPNFPLPAHYTCFAGNRKSKCTYLNGKEFFNFKYFLLDQKVPKNQGCLNFYCFLRRENPRKQTPHPDEKSGFVKQRFLSTSQRYFHLLENYIKIQKADQKVWVATPNFPLPAHYTCFAGIRKSVPHPRPLSILRQAQERFGEGSMGIKNAFIV